MTDRKQPTAGFWIVVALVAVLVAYPLSIGPATWLRDQAPSQKLAWRIFSFCYAPVLWVYDRSPQPVKDTVEWYAGLFVDP